MKAFLYKIDDGTHDTEGQSNALFVVSSIDEQGIRNDMAIHDPGGMSYEDFERVWQTGKIEKIVSIDQVSPEHLAHIPFCTGELSDPDNDVASLVEQMNADGELSIPRWDEELW